MLSGQKSYAELGEVLRRGFETITITLRQMTEAAEAIHRRYVEELTEQEPPQ